MRTAQLGMFRCPSDLRQEPIQPQDWDVSSSWRGTLARGNYVGSYGNMPFLNEAPWVPSIHLPGVDIVTGESFNARGVFYRNSRTRIADITDGLSQTFLVGEKSGAKSMASWVGAIPGTKWRSANDQEVYGGIPTNLPAAMVLGHACQQHPPSSADGVAEDFSAQHPAGVNFLFGDGAVRTVTPKVNMRVYPFTASIADGRALQIDF